MKHTVEEVTLESGAKGLLIDVPEAPVTTFDFNFRAGYFSSPQNKWEVPHVLEHLMFNGNEHHKSSQAFNAALEQNGAYANAFTSGWNVGYNSECAAFETSRIAELVLQSLTSPLFLDHEFKAEMGNVREELQGYLNNYYRVLNVAMMENAGLLALNDPERIVQLKNISRDDIVQHHKKTHTAHNFRFVIGGDMTKIKSELLRLLEDYSAKLPTGKHFDLPNETPVAEGDLLSIQRTDVKKLHYYLDLYLPNKRFNQKEEAAARIANRLLTGGMSSKLFGEARRRGLAYGMSSSATKGVGDTRWWFGGNVGNINAQELFSLIVEEVKKLATGNVTNEEVEAAKLQALGSFLRSSQRVGDMVRGYDTRYYFDGTIVDFSGIPDEIKSVTKDQIVDLTKEFIDAKTWDLGLLGQIDDEQGQTLHKTIATLFD